jgi:protein-S-isoprenylcysteine O-methyltransferase Ste14
VTELSERVMSAILIGAFAAFMLVAQIARARGRRRRGPSVQRAVGIAQWSPYFFWVPYAVIWLRPGPSLELLEPITWLGLALGVGGVAFALWAIVAIGRHYDLELEVHADHEVVRTGPYRLVRHPIYTGLLIHLIGACLATGNLLLAAGTFLVVLPIFYLRARIEEELLRKQLGPAYDAYAREVGMVIPFVGRRAA